MSDTIKKVCAILNLNDNDIFTFQDFIEAKFNKPYKEVENNPEVISLREAWNMSCESLLNVLNGITYLDEKLKKEE